MTKPRKRIIDGSPVDELLGELEEPKKPKAKPQKTAGGVPEGYRLDPRYIEKKTARLQLVLKPSVSEKLKAYCKAKGISINDFIGTMIEERLNNGD